MVLTLSRDPVQRVSVMLVALALCARSLGYAQDACNQLSGPEILRRKPRLEKTARFRIPAG